MVRAFGLPPALRRKAKSVFVGRPIVQRRRIEVRPVGPRQRMDLGVDPNAVENVEIPQRAVQFPRKDSTALGSHVASFEPGHPFIARSQSNLALVLQDLGGIEEARDLLRKAYRSLRDKLGPEHTKTKTVLGNLRGLGGEPG